MSRKEPKLTGHVAMERKLNCFVRKTLAIVSEKDYTGFQKPRGQTERREKGHQTKNEREKRKYEKIQSCVQQLFCVNCEETILRCGISAAFLLF